ncbi:glycine betaine ABC transporter substrate-binding protein [Paenibacillus sp. FSL W7-1287]|uniref:glycine betaine ABC transporter substrate-binding protein n=1 Tax=Paenibacillus sp. FSL W7-1287 TaxID=2954538 RepID=UPI0030F9319C
MKRKGLKLITAITLLATVVLSGCSNGGSQKITIGTQTYSEPKIIAEMYKALIEENTDITVDIVADLAASPIVIQSMDKNDIQMATLYSGEIFNNYFEIEDTKDRQEVLRQAQQGFDENYNFKWFDGFGFENTYAFTVRKELADEYQLTKVSDLKNYADTMKLGVDTTWLERDNDGYRPFQEHYGITFNDVFPMEISLVYQAVADEQVDVVLAYTTDPGIKEFNLQTLEDDLQFFPPFDASPVLRKDTLEKHPELEEIVMTLVGKIDAATMTSLNYEVDVNKRSPKEVAVEFLKENNLLKSEA